MIRISSELASQHISKNRIADLLYYLDRTKWERKYNRHQLDIEPWWIGIWVKQVGIISYKDLEHRFSNGETRPKSNLHRVNTEDENRAEAYHTMIVTISKSSEKFNQLSRKSALLIQVYSV